MQTSSLQQKPLTDGACDGSSPDSGSPHVPSLDPGPPSDKLLNATCRQKLGSCASRRNLPPTACLARLRRRGPSRARSGVLRDPPTARAAGLGPGSARVTRVARTIRWPETRPVPVAVGVARESPWEATPRMSPASCTGGPGPGTRTSGPFRRSCGCWSPDHALRTGAAEWRPRDPSGARAHGVPRATGKCVGDAQWPWEHLGVRRPLRAGEDTGKRGPRC